MLGIPSNHMRTLCQKRVLGAGTSNYFPRILILWDAITSPGPLYLLLGRKSSLFEWIMAACDSQRLLNGCPVGEKCCTNIVTWERFLHYWSFFDKTLRWRHNGLDSVSNHQPYECLLNRSFGGRSKKTSKLRVTGLCVGNSPVTGEFPAQMASNAENVSIWWRHHESVDTDGFFLCAASNAGLNILLVVTPARCWTKSRRHGMRNISLIVITLIAVKFCVLSDITAISK